MLPQASESRVTQPRPGTPGARAAAMARATRAGRAGRDDLAWMRAAARRMVLHARVR